MSNPQKLSEEKRGIAPRRVSVKAKERLLAEIVRRIKEGMQPTRIILFGSHAYGRPDQDSDFDLMIIVPHSHLPQHRRAQSAYACVGAVGAAKDLLVLTEEEFEHQSRVVTSLARLVRDQGKVLYERRETPRDTQLAAEKRVYPT
jgi:predicted nucleotidyltransferase